MRRARPARQLPTTRRLRPSRMPGLRAAVPVCRWRAARPSSPAAPEYGTRPGGPARLRGKPPWCLAAYPAGEWAAERSGAAPLARVRCRPQPSKPKQWPQFVMFVSSVILLVRAGACRCVPVRAGVCRYAPRLRRLPASRFRRAEQRIDDGHVADGVLEWHRHFALATHGLREQVALDGVLVADRECFGLDAGAEQVGAVVHKDAARLVVRRVEWNLDLDPAAGSEQLHALIGNQLGRAGEDRLAGGEIEHGGSEAVRVHIGVAFQQGHHAARFLAEDEAGSVDGIAADIEQPSAAPRAHITDVGAVAIEIAEEAHDGAQFADAAAADQIAGAQPLRMRAHHESFAHLHAGAGLRFEQLAGFGGVESQRLLAEHVLSGLGRAHRPGHVQVIGQRVVDRLDLRIGQQFLVGTVGFGNAEGGGRLLGLRQVARGYGGDLAPLAPLHGGYDLLHGYIGGTQNAPTDFAHHSISNVPRYSISEWFMRYWS